MPESTERAARRGAGSTRQPKPARNIPGERPEAAFLSHWMETLPRNMRFITLTKHPQDQPATRS